MRKKMATHHCAAKFREETSKKAQRQGRRAAMQHRGVERLLQEIFANQKLFSHTR
jgi:hypothetical protein